MNTEAILALIGDLYGQIVALQKEIAELRKQLEQK
jgi:hypothetical protein